MKLKGLFGINRSQGTVMQDNTVLSDGHTHNDLLAISVEKMQDYLGVKKEKDFYKLFEGTLAKVEEELHPTALVSAGVPEGVTVVLAKPVEEMFIEHNGKTYKLTEVVAAPAESKVADNSPVYPQGPKAPEVTAPKAKRTRAKRGAAKAKAN